VAISALLLVFAALKIYIFSLGNHYIALAVLNAGQQFTILASSIYSVMLLGAGILILHPIAFPAAGRAGTLRSSNLTGTFKHYILMIFAWSLIIILAPTYFIGFMLVMTVWYRFVFRSKSMKRRRKPSPKKKSILQRLFAFAFSANIVLLVIALASSPWTPQENVSFTQNGTDVKVSGYMIGQQGKQLLLVETSKSAVQWIGEDAIRSRAVCASRKDVFLVSKPVLVLATSVFGHESKDFEDCLSTGSFTFLN